MPLALRKFGQESIRVFRKMDSKYIKDVSAIYANELYPLLDQLVGKIAFDLTEGNPSYVDWSVWDRQQKNYLSQMNTTIRATYDKLARLGQQSEKAFFFVGRKIFINLFKSLFPARFVSVASEGTVSVLFESYSEVREASPKIDIVLAGGKVNDQFKRYVRKQLETGTEPGMLIKTISADHVKELQRLFVTELNAGRNIITTREEFIKRMGLVAKSPELRKKMEFNVLRILRTSYSNAVNEDFTNFMSENEQLFEKKLRMADGRPCLACVMLDGKEYPISASMDDHPAGMCYFIPVAKTLGDLGFDTDKLPKKLQSNWDNYSQDVPLMRSRFWKLPEAEQRKVFGNQKLYDLWKKEKFPIDYLSRKSGNFTLPLTYKDALRVLPDLGGISNPLCSFADDAARKLNSVIDPLDRANKDIKIALKKPSEKVVNQYGLDPYGMGKNLSGVPENVLNDVRKYSVLSDDPTNMHWYDFNQRSRILGLYTRKDTKNRMYYALSKDINTKPFVSTIKVGK